MKTRLSLLVLLLAVGVGLPRAATAEGGFHFDIGVAYSEGIHDAFSDLEDLYELGGFQIDDSFEVPFGLMMHFYYELNCGFGFGASLGPTALFAVTEDIGSDEDSELSGVIPLGIDLRYTLLRERNVSPYVRAGFRYPLTFGDNLDAASPGASAAVGVEFYRNRAVGFGLEVGYDSSKVDVIGPGGTREATFAGFTVALFAHF